ncbi:hypothetical protein ABXS75_07760 [Roseburia hominis]
MKQKRFIWFFIVEAIIFSVLSLLQIRFLGFFTTIIAFPFEQIGFALRALSLSSATGNVAAILVYLLLSLSPCAVYILLVKKHKERRIDALLVIVSILLFIVIYYMINPALSGFTVPGGGKIILGSAFYSVLFGYLVLRVLCVYASAEEAGLQRGLKTLLVCLNSVFVYAVFWGCLGNLCLALHEVGTQNTTYFEVMSEDTFSGVSPLMPTYFFLILQFLVNALPYLLDIVVVFLAIRVLEELEKDRYSDGSVASVEKLAGFCVKALAVTVAADMIFSILQLMFGNVLCQINMTVTIPVTSVIFVLVVLLLSRYIREDQKLKQDNDLFV